MQKTWEKLEAALQRWSLRIEQLEAKVQLRGANASFETLTHIDELKALHVIAQSKLENFKAGGGTGGEARLEAELKRAWKEAEAAFKKQMP